MIDLAPTLLALMGVPDQGNPSGRDASALLLGGDVADWPDEAHVHRYQQVFKDEGKGPDTLNPFACTFTQEYELVVQEVDASILYRRSDYSDNLVNLFDDPGYASVRKDLAQRMLAVAEAVNDPKLAWLAPKLMGL